MGVAAEDLEPFTVRKVHIKVYVVSAEILNMLHIFNER